MVAFCKYNKVVRTFIVNIKLYISDDSVDTD